MKDILQVESVSVTGPYELDLSFNDGTSKTVNVRPLLYGPVFEPLLDPQEFAKAYLDPMCRTVVWPNGADLAPEALYALEPVSPSVETTTKR